LPDGIRLSLDDTVYLSARGSHHVTMPNLYFGLTKLLPNKAARGLEALYKNPQASTEVKMRDLLEAFPQERVALLLDNADS
jgi:hypothetical protein